MLLYNIHFIYKCVQYTFYHHKGPQCCPFIAAPHPSHYRPTLNSWPSLMFFLSVILPIQECYANGITEYVTSCVNVVHLLQLMSQCYAIII